MSSALLLSSLSGPIRWVKSRATPLAMPVLLTFSALCYRMALIPASPSPSPRAGYVPGGPFWRSSPGPSPFASMSPRLGTPALPLSGGNVQYRAQPWLTQSYRPTSPTFNRGSDSDSDEISDEDSDYVPGPRSGQVRAASRPPSPTPPPKKGRVANQFTNQREAINNFVKTQVRPKNVVCRSAPVVRLYSVSALEFI
jgi:hypothetical protein